MKNEILDRVNKFYSILTSPNVKNHRYLSWEHCYNYFFDAHDGKIKFNEDLGALHLAFYLASWGMYRGSSFILQKDYKAFKNIVNIIMDKRYNSLWNIKQNYKQKKELVILFDELYKKIERLLSEIKNDISYHKDLSIDSRNRYNVDRISGILVTKIILGTIGCIPAYDRFFRKGLKQRNMIQLFNPKRSFEMLLDFYKENKEKIDLL